MIPQRTSGRLSLVLCLLLVLLCLEATSAIYLPRKEEPEVNSRPEVVDEYESAKEDNQIYRHHETSDFRYDEDILRYLRVCGRQLMIWRCRNAVQSYWDRVTGIVPFVDLYCSVIGNVATVDWYHKQKKINSDAEQRSSQKYDEARKDHQEGGRHFTVWTDHRLRIHNLTTRDSGMYRFEVTSPDGDQVDQQFIFVDVSSGGSGSGGSSKWGSDANNNHTKQRKKKKKKKTKTKTKRLWHYAPLTVDPSTD